MFFVASAPSSPEGRVNCSPRGNRGELKVVTPRRLVWADQTGSGAETAAHLRENGRLVLMACAFSGPPRIVRVHGRGWLVLPGEAEFPGLAAQLPAFLSSTEDREPDAGGPAAEGFGTVPATVEVPAGIRALVVLEVERVSSSCGYGVPLMRFEGHRPQLDEWAARKGPAGLAEYRARHNAWSIDGLPAFPAPEPG